MLDLDPRTQNIETIKGKILQTEQRFPIERIKQMHHCLSFLVDNMPAYFTHQNREGKKHVEESNMEVRWSYNLASRQPLTELKRETQLSKLQSHLPSLRTILSHGKHCRDMTTAANRGKIEFISETALNIINVSKPYKDKLLYVTPKKPSL